MTRLHLVRHGQAAAGWDVHADPGLDDVGVAQAEAMAGSLAAHGPLPIVVSPLRRTRETAAALERRWGCTSRVAAAVGEIATPATLGFDGRGAWLRSVLASRWGDVDPELRAWRDTALDALRAIDEETVVVTHFVAINVAVGAADRDDRVVCFLPDNCSRTVLNVDRDTGALQVVERGAEARTVVT